MRSIQLRSSSYVAGTRPLLLSVALLLSCAITSSSAQTSHELSTREIAARATPATVTIVTIAANGDTIAQGSGFFVRSSGVLVTNWHVMQGASRAVVIRPNGERFERVRFLDGDSAIDLAVLKVPGYALPVLTPRAMAPSVGDRVVAIGSPLGLARTVTEGIVSAVRMADGRQLIQISAPISHGSSGGAVLDAQGRVFAISTSQMSEGQQLNFAVPVRYALGLLSDSPHERSLAEIFASGTAARANTAHAADAASANYAAAALPPRAKVPRPSMDGVWFGTEHVGDSTKSFAIGQMLVLAGGEGFMTFANVVNDTLADAFGVLYIADARATSDGKVAFSIGNLAYDGYETDDGFLMGAVWGTDVFSAPRRSVVHYTVSDLPLTENTGPYDVTQCRTWWYSRNNVQSADHYDWAGTLVAAVNHDTLYLTVNLHNASGGTTGLVGKGMLAPDGSFSISSKATSLSGTIRHGVLTGEWRDVRDGAGSFRGTLGATRR